MMDNHSTDNPPDSRDLDAWRSAASSGLLCKYRLEDIVAAIQDLELTDDMELLHLLAKYISDSMLCILRSLVGVNHPNRGQDIIDDVHSQLWEALLRPTSADGLGLRKAFVPRLKYRIKDAIAKNSRLARAEGNPVLGTAAGSLESRQDSDKRSGGKLIYGSALLQDAPGIPDRCDQRLDVESVLERIPDPLKRLAFRLHMEGLPFKSSKGDSISKTLGVNEATIRMWVESTQAILSQDKLVLEMKSMNPGDKS
jgi:hypothetical protein